MLNFDELKSNVNITTLRLFNPYVESFRNIAYKYFPNIPNNQITVSISKTN